MGVGLSSEASRKVSYTRGEPFSDFVLYNKKELLYLVEQLKATEELAVTGISFEEDDDGGTGGSSKKSFTEKELADMFAPYESIRLPNHYLSDLALLLPLSLLRSPDFHLGDYMEVLSIDDLVEIVEEASKRHARATRSGQDGEPGEQREGGSQDGEEEEAVDALMLLARNAYLRVLDLSFNSLHGSVSMAALTNSLSCCPNLTHLSLAGNAIESEGCELLGKWLATDPPLQSLSIGHSDLCDVFVCPALFPNALLTNTHLLLLNISFTDITDATVLAILDTVGCDTSQQGESTTPSERQPISGRNTTLAVVLFESVLHDPRTFLPVPSAYNNSNNADYTNTVLEYACDAEGVFRSGFTYYDELDNSSSGKATPEPASHDTQRDADDNADTVKALAAKERFQLRRRLLQTDLAGRVTLSPSLCALLYEHLAPRREAYCEMIKETQQRATQPSDGSGAPRKSRGLIGEVDGGDPTALVSLDEVAADGTATFDENGPSAVVVGNKALLRSLRGASTRRKNHFQNIYTESDPRRVNEASKHRGSLKRKLPPFNSSERLALIREDIQTFKATHSTTDKTGDRVGEKVLQNGFDRIYMPPVKKSGTRSLNEVVVQEMPHRLRPCWCNPNDASLPYAGILHYHCVCEEYIEYGQDSAAGADPNGKGTSGKNGKKGRGANAEGKNDYGYGAHADRTAGADADVGEYKKPQYHGCQGTGHHCLSDPSGGDHRYDNSVGAARSRKFKGDRYTVYHSDSKAASATHRQQQQQQQGSGPRSSRGTYSSFTGTDGGSSVNGGAGGPSGGFGSTAGNGSGTRQLVRTLPPLAATHGSSKPNASLQRSAAEASGATAKPGSVFNANTQRRYNPVEYFSSAFQPTAPVIVEEYSF